MSSKKISDEELKKEAKSCKSLDEIKNEYGYSKDSRRPMPRLREMGFIRLNKVNFHNDSASANISIPGRFLELSEQRKDFDFSVNVFYEVSVTDDGDFLVCPRENQLVQKDGDE